MGGGVRSWLVDLASLWVGGDSGGTSIYRQSCSWVHFVTFHYSCSVVSRVCFLCCFLPFQLCPECPVLWIGHFLVFRILWFLFPLLCPRWWRLCCVWSVFCISLLPFQSLFLCTRSWLTLLLFCLVPVVLFGGGWLVVVFPLVFALSCGWCVGFLLSILLSSSLATTCILAPGVRCMLSFVSGSLVLYSLAVLDGVVGVHLGDHSVIADGFMVSFCWGSVGGQLETWYLQDLLPFGIPDHWWVIYFLTLCSKSILVPVGMHNNHVQDQSKVSAYPAEELRIQPVKWWSPWEGRPANKQRGSIASCTLMQHLGRSGKLSFFIIYKFWQNCASVRQVSDLILKTVRPLFHLGHLNICDYF